MRLILRGEMKMNNDIKNTNKTTTTKNRAYKQKAVTTKIIATSRSSVKIRDNFYTVELTEERTIDPNARGVDLNKEYDLLWNSINESVDRQIIDIKNVFAKKQ